MSEQTPDVVEIPLHGDAAFTALMDALAPEPDPAQDAAGDGAAGGAPAAGGQPGDTGAPAGGAAAPAAAPAAGADAAAGGGAAPAQPGDQPATGQADAAAVGGGAGADAGPAGGTLPATWTATSAELIPKFGELSTALEERTLQAYQTSALEEVQTEHAQYFEALQQHPRTLVGSQVPRINGEGMEVLRDTEDAKEWQEAVKMILVEEIKERAGKAMDDNSTFLTTIHASIELFSKNPDLIPGTKEFDVELADQFATLATPYELRVEGKLQGYSIPVQPIIEQLRSRLQADRAARLPSPPAAGGAPVAPAAGGAVPSTPPAVPPDPPQAGLQSKAGSGTETEDFSVLFGTIGLPNLQI